jgi:hypothetical protein
MLGSITLMNSANPDRKRAAMTSAVLKATLARGTLPTSVLRDRFLSWISSWILGSP